MGMHLWERISMECLVLIHDIWNAILGSQFVGLFISRKSCGQCRSTCTNFHRVRNFRWPGLGSEGISKKLPLDGSFSGAFGRTLY